MRLKRIWGRERKEEDLMIKIVLGSRIFFFECAENARVFATFMMLERMGEEKERKRTLEDDSYKVLNLAFLFSCF